MTEHGRTNHVGFGIAAALIGIVGNQVVSAGTTVQASEHLGRAVEDAVAAAVPEAQAVLWCPRVMPGVAL